MLNTFVVGELVVVAATAFYAEMMLHISIFYARCVQSILNDANFGFVVISSLHAFYVFRRVQ